MKSLLIAILFFFFLLVGAQDAFAQQKKDGLEMLKIDETGVTIRIKDGGCSTDFLVKYFTKMYAEATKDADHPDGRTLAWEDVYRANIGHVIPVCRLPEGTIYEGRSDIVWSENECLEKSIALIPGERMKIVMRYIEPPPDTNDRLTKQDECLKQATPECVNGLITSLGGTPLNFTPKPDDKKADASPPVDAPPVPSDTPPEVGGDDQVETPPATWTAMEQLALGFGIATGILFIALICFIFWWRSAKQELEEMAVEVERLVDLAQELANELAQVKAPKGPPIEDTTRAVLAETKRQLATLQGDMQKARKYVDETATLRKIDLGNQPLPLLKSLQKLHKGFDKRQEDALAAKAPTQMSNDTLSKLADYETAYALIEEDQEPKITTDPRPPLARLITNLRDLHAQALATAKNAFEEQVENLKKELETVRQTIAELAPYKLMVTDARGHWSDMSLAGRNALHYGNEADKASELKVDEEIEAAMSMRSEQQEYLFMVQAHHEDLTKTFVAIVGATTEEFDERFFGLAPGASDEPPPQSRNSSLDPTTLYEGSLSIAPSSLGAFEGPARDEGEECAEALFSSRRGRTLRGLPPVTNGSAADGANEQNAQGFRSIYLSTEKSGSLTITPSVRANLKGIHQAMAECDPEILGMYDKEVQDHLKSGLTVLECMEALDQVADASLKKRTEIPPKNTSADGG